MLSPADFPAIETPVPRLDVVGSFDALLNYPPVKSLIPVPVLIAIAPLVWLLFRKTWEALDEEARQHSRTREALNLRPIVCLLLLAVTLTFHDYYGGKGFFTSTLEPILRSWETGGAKWLRVSKYENLYSYAWWAGARIFGYLVVPLLVWKSLFRRDRLLDMGLRVKGLWTHWWIYLLCLGVVFAAMGLLSTQKDFLTYYPFYKQASRSWFDLLAWEALYFAQFFALEFYFRGWMLESLRKTMGATAIFVMAVPYCMIHYGKPYLEAHGAIVAGVVLGSLAMKTRSIYAGFLVHVAVAGVMDFLALSSRGAIPTRFWP